MHAQGSLRIQFASNGEAAAADAALSPDDEGHVTHKVEGEHLLIDGESDTWMGLLRSLDDVLTCLRVLEGADADAVAQPTRGPASGQG